MVHPHLRFTFLCGLSWIHLQWHSTTFSMMKGSSSCWLYFLIIFSEKINVAHANLDVVQRLTAELARWAQASIPPVMLLLLLPFFFNILAKPLPTCVMSPLLFDFVFNNYNLGSKCDTRSKRKPSFAQRDYRALACLTVYFQSFFLPERYCDI